MRSRQQIISFSMSFKFNIVKNLSSDHEASPIRSFGKAGHLLLVGNPSLKQGTTADAYIVPIYFPVAFRVKLYAQCVKKIIKASETNVEESKILTSHGSGYATIAIEAQNTIASHINVRTWVKTRSSKLPRFL